MANYNVAAGETGAYGKTLVASTADTVTFTRPVGFVDVFSDGTSPVYFTVDGTTPVVDGAKTMLVHTLAPGMRRVRVPKGESPTIVSVISAGTPKYSVAEARD